MRKNKIWMSVTCIAMLLTSCGKQKVFVAGNFAVSPTPLEYMAGDVPATISINVPAKTMNKKAIITCTPIIKWDGGTSAGDGFTLQGEKVEANNTIISYKNGGHATMRFSVPFESTSSLLIAFAMISSLKSGRLSAVPACLSR